MVQLRREFKHRTNQRKRRRLEFEPLEQRRLLSATPQLVEDIKPGSGSSITAPSMTDVNGTLFFRANDGTSGYELWKSDGTAAGTVLVKDINPGASNSLDPVRTYLANVNGTLFFRANDGTSGYELWKSDGTAAGTMLVKDIKPGSGSSVFPAPSPTNVNGTLFFMANDGTSGYELWKSDGTAAGTVLVKDIRPGSVDSAPFYLANVNGTLFFRANDGTSGIELWKSDGTNAGTMLVKDISPGSTDSLPRRLTNLNGTLLFEANDGTSGFELWKSNGTAAGTVLVKDIRPGSNSSLSIVSARVTLTNLAGTLFFSANDGTSGDELWTSDGTTAGTVLVSDINPGASGSLLDAQMANVNGTLLFEANDGTNGYELWKSNGTGAGTVVVKDIRPGAFSSFPGDLANLNGTLFFGANDGTNGSELWTSDGTTAGTVLVQDIRPGSGGSGPRYLTNVHGTLFFTANDGTHGVEPWVLQVPSAVAGTSLFYKGSTKWNVTNGATFSDDNAIAPDKTAYLPGSGTSAFSAVSSYDKGINGIMVDLSGTHGALTASDFIFKVGNNNSPSLWATATGPTTVTTRAAAGSGGSDRVELLWANNAIQKQWLEVIVKGNDTLGGSNTNTGLASSYVFLFGNGIGESGNAPTTSFQVTSADEISARNDPHSIGNPATRSNNNDFNRDGLVNSADQIIARNNITTIVTQLKLLVIGAGGPFAPVSSPESLAISGGPSYLSDMALTASSRLSDAGIATALAAGQTLNAHEGASGAPAWPLTSLQSTAVDADIRATVFDSLGVGADTLDWSSLVSYYVNERDTADDVIGSLLLD